MSFPMVGPSETTTSYPGMMTNYITITVSSTMDNYTGSTITYNNYVVGNQSTVTYSSIPYIPDPPAPAKTRRLAPAPRRWERLVSRKPSPPPSVAWPAVMRRFAARGV